MASENWKLETWLYRRHETSLTRFHSMPFLFYEMKGYFASRRLLLLLNLLRKLGNLSVKMATANIQGCQRHYFAILSSINKLKNNSRFQDGNNEFSSPRQKGRWWLCFPLSMSWWTPEFSRKKCHDVRFLLAFVMGCLKKSLNLTLQISLDDLGLRVRIMWLFSLSFLD